MGDSKARAEVARLLIANTREERAVLVENVTPLEVGMEHPRGANDRN
jgi:hypothetical protein